MFERSLAKVARLPQRNVTWQATARRARAWITPDDRPSYRPYTILVMDADTDLVRRNAIQEDRPAADDVLSQLLDAMLKPMLGSGRRYRPSRILLDDRDMVQALAPRLAKISVGCDYQAALPLINGALKSMEAHMNRGEVQQSLVEVPGMTLPLLEELYAAAAAFFRAAPWRWMDNFAAVELRYPADAPARYAVIMGFGGEEFGLVIWQTLDDLRLQFSGLEPPELFEKITSSSLTFDDPTILAFEDLDAIEEQGWEIAGSRAYPLMIKVVPPGNINPPGSAEIAMFAAALRTLPDFVTDHLHANRGTSRAADATFPLPNIHGGQQITLRYPVDLPELEAMRQEVVGDDEELETLIADWHWDEASHGFARQVGAFMLDFMAYLAWTGLLEETLQKHGRNAWLIGRFSCAYGDFETFRPEIFLDGPRYETEFKRKVSESPAALKSYGVTWRKLARFVREIREQ